MEHALGVLAPTGLVNLEGDVVLDVIVKVPAVTQRNQP
jgi:hypothetical protein